MTRRKVFAALVALAFLSIAVWLLKHRESKHGGADVRAFLPGGDGEGPRFEPLGLYDENTPPKGPLQLSCLLRQCRAPGTRAPQQEGPLFKAACEAVGMARQPDLAFSVAGYSWDSLGALVFLGFHERTLLHRVSMVFPPAAPQLVRVRQITPLQTVHIIVGIRNRQNQLKKFLLGILAQLLPQDPNFVLHIAYSSSEADGEVPDNNRTPHPLKQSAVPTYEDTSTSTSEEDYKHVDFHERKVWSTERTRLHQTKQMVKEILEHVPQLKWTWQVHSSCWRVGSGFSRGCVINSAARQLQPHDLLLLVDVDMSIDPEALLRCRTNTRLGRQVYFPVAFSLFNPNGPFNSSEKVEKKSSGFNQIISSARQNVRNISVGEDQSEGTEYASEQLSRTDASAAKHIVNKRIKNNRLEQTGNHSKQQAFDYQKRNSKGKFLGDLGLWRVYGFGMACLHQQDLVKSGGLPETAGWGGEDLQFFRKLVKLDGMEVVRGAEPGLVHEYHNKDCGEQSGATEDSARVGPAMLPQCLKSKVLAEGSQEALSAAVLRAGLLQ